MRTLDHDVDGGRLPLLVSPGFGDGFRHAFTTRVGGTSVGPYESLNMGGKWGDAAAHVAANRCRVLGALNADRLVVATQVHGARVIRVRANDPAEAVANERADGVVTDVPGLAIAVFVADCVPVLLADPVSGACGAVHAGWRGVVTGVAEAAVTAMQHEFGTRAANLRAALGPCIGACCFEVGIEVAAEFERAMEPPWRNRVLIDRHGAKAHIDLRAALQLQLERAGVPADNCGAAADCTRCDPGQRFYSYRRDGSRTGQQVGIVLRSRAG